MNLFSDRGRPAKIAITLALLMVLGAYYSWIAMDLEAGYRWCLDDPEGRDGASLVFPLWTVTRVDDAGHFAISKIVKDIPIVGDAAALHVGDTVSIVGTFRASDRAVLESYREVHTLRKYKELLGIIGFVAVVLAAPFAFRIRAGRLVDRG